MSERFDGPKIVVPSQAVDEGEAFVAALLDLVLKGRGVAAVLVHNSRDDCHAPPEMAVQRRLPKEGLLTHSDRGSQYASEHYQRLLAKHGIECSRSGVGQCWDNAPMESFFASLKKELVHQEDYLTRAEARASIFEYIEMFYNNQRRHSSLGYVSPAEYEQPA